MWSGSGSKEGKCVVVGGKSKGILRSREISLRSF